MHSKAHAQRTQPDQTGVCHTQKAIDRPPVAKFEAPSCLERPDCTCRDVGDTHAQSLADRRVRRRSKNGAGGALSILPRERYGAQRETPVPIETTAFIIRAQGSIPTQRLRKSDPALSQLELTRGGS